VQDAGAPSGEGRRVVPGLQAVTRGLDSVEGDLGVLLEECAKDADRVRAATDTSHDRVG